MQWLMTSHVRRYHCHYGTSGHVWQKRYKSFIVEKDEHLLTIVRYIEGNPVRAGLVASAKDWVWSSHSERVGTGGKNLIRSLSLSIPVEWTDYVDTPLTVEELEKVRRSVTRQAPYGGTKWQEQISKQLGIETTMRPRGRPGREIKK